MLKLMFWNLKNNGNEKLLVDIIRENSIDILILSEFESTNFKLVISELNNEFDLHPGYGACKKVILLARKSVEVIVRREQSRYVLYSCTIDDFSYVIVGIHLPVNPNSNSELRKNVIRELVKDIDCLETELKIDNTIVIGDFNSSPFDDELIQKDTFNAVLFKELILRSEYVTIEGKRYRRFYNPMVNFISEDQMNYGSLYYNSGMNSIYWYCFDQIIVRKPLVNLLASIKYCKKINKRNLLNKFVPNKKISDHLPLLVHFERMA